MTVHDLAAALPDIDTLRDRCRAPATLDAVLGAGLESRYHWFGPHEPGAFAAQVAAPALSFAGELEATVCLWRPAGDDRWHCGDIDFPDGDDPDGADWMFPLVVDPGGYAEWARDHYERDVDGAAVAEILAGRPLTAELVGRLNPETSLTGLADDLAEIGRPG